MELRCFAIIGTMRPTFLLLLVFSTNLSSLRAQPGKPRTLHIGDSAPPLRLQQWLKGEPIESFEKGHVYVLEFWATWCAPCRAAIPRISKMAEKYEGRASFIGIDLFGQETATLPKLQRFVDSMGSRMNYPVAIEKDSLMYENYLVAIGHGGVPSSVIVNKEGKIAWVGHPAMLDEILPKILHGNWDLAKAREKREEDLYLDSLDHETYYRLKPYLGESATPHDFGRTDLVQVVIQSIVTNEPRLQYAPRMAYHTFAVLLKTDIDKAYEYGRKVLVTPTYQPPAFDAIEDCVDWYSKKMVLPPKIYALGAEALEKEIEMIPYQEICDMHKFYTQLAEWYSLANNKRKAIQAQKKAIAALKNKKDFSADDLAASEFRLQKYQGL